MPAPPATVPESSETGQNLSRSRAQLTMQESSEQEERFCWFERLRSLALWGATGGDRLPIFGCHQLMNTLTRFEAKAIVPVIARQAVSSKTA